MANERQKVTMRINGVNVILSDDTQSQSYVVVGVDGDRPTQMSALGMRFWPQDAPDSWSTMFCRAIQMAVDHHHQFREGHA